MTLLITLTLIARLVISHYYPDPEHIVNYSLAARLFEFLSGIIAAKIYTANTTPKWLRSTTGLLAGFCIAFIGRLLMTGSVVLRPDGIGLLARVINIPLLTCGYGMVMLSVLSSRSYVS